MINFTLRVVVRTAKRRELVRIRPRSRSTKPKGSYGRLS